MGKRRIHACSSLLRFSTLSILAASCRIVVVVAQPFSDVTWRVCSGQGCSGKTASVLPACTICTSMSSGPRSMLKAIVNVVVALQLGLFDAAAADDALERRRADVSSMFTTRSALTACLSMSQHSLKKSRCVLACLQQGCGAPSSSWRAS